MNCNPGSFVTSDYWLEHDQVLRQHVANNLTSGQVAARMGVSRNAIVGRARRLGLSWSLPGRGGYAKTPGPMEPNPRPWAFPPPQHCLYPYGDPGDLTFRFCGDEVVEFGHPYCAEHHLLCYQRLIPHKIKG